MAGSRKYSPKRKKPAADAAGAAGDSGDSAWKAELLRDGRWAIRPVLANVLTAFEKAPAWEGCLAFDAFSYRTRLRRPPPWMRQDAAVEGLEWSDEHDVRATRWLQEQGVLASLKTVADAVEAAARIHIYNPVREYLEGLAWDGTERLGAWPITFLAAKDTEYIRTVGRRWMISAVARVFQPGVKADHALILEGPQGLLKSTALKTLGHRWFTDDVGEFGNKDTVMQIAGMWIVELPELDALRRSDLNAVKAFLTRTRDRIRLPYGRRIVELERQCVLAGTTNRDTYLLDETGGRRFWPIFCHAIDLDGLRDARDQLWAEAVAAWRNGERWWLDTPELIAQAGVEQSARREPDVWQEPIQAFLVGKNFTTVTEVLKDACKVLLDKQDDRSAKRVARCLRIAGWWRTQGPRKYGRPWRYVPAGWSGPWLDDGAEDDAQSGDGTSSATGDRAATGDTEPIE